MEKRNLFSKFADVKIKKHTDMETKTKTNTASPQIQGTSIFGDFDVEEYERNLRPYTMEEINAMLDEAEAQEGIPDEEAWSDEELELIGLTRADLMDE